MRPLEPSNGVSATANEGRTTACVRPVETPDGFLKRCGSRLVAVCPGCARLYQGDWAAIFRSGFSAEYRYFLLTLTAPSFGPTHRVLFKGEPRRCACGLIHGLGDESLAGAPLDRRNYEYLECVRWNRDVGQLWDATRSRLRKAFPAVEYAVVREWQRRGALHSHVLLRFPGEERVSGSDVARIARSVHTVSRVDGVERTWGKQATCDPFPTGEQAPAAVAYLMKALGYVLKSTGAGRPASRADTPSATHLKVLGQAARLGVSCGLDDCYGYGIESCTAAMHDSFGASARMVSVSRMTEGRRGWSLSGLSRSTLREHRAMWARGEESPA